MCWKLAYELDAYALLISDTN